MIDHRTIRDTVRNPGNDTSEAARGGARPAAKKKAATKKAVDETAKKAAKKAAGKTAKKKAATKKTVTKTAAKKKATKKTTGPGGTSADRGVKKKAANRKVAGAVAAPSSAPDTPVPDTTASPSSSESPAGGPVAAERVPRPLAPVHAGARTMDMGSEEPGGIGGFLALWGPLIIVGFLVLVFLGGDERESAMAAGPDASAPASAMAPVAAAEEPRTAGSTPGSAGVPPVGGFGDAGAPSMPAGPRTAVAWADSGGGYPSPPGPYRNPGTRGLPAGESWTARAGEWAPPAGSRSGPGHGAGDGSPPMWVRCAAPYYWCLAPTTPPAW